MAQAVNNPGQDNRGDVDIRLLKSLVLDIEGLVHARGAADKVGEGRVIAITLRASSITYLLSYRN